MNQRRMAGNHVGVVCGLLAAACALALALLAPASAWADPNTSWYDGHESDSSYTVTNVLDLQGLAQLVNSGVDFAGKTVTFDGGTLGNELRLTGEWTPIGTAEHPFNGTFDGNGLRVTRLSVTETTDGAGFFGYVGTGTVSNLRVGGTIDIQNPGVVVSNVGGIAGKVEGSVDSCETAVKITINSNMNATEDALQVVDHVGGIAGWVKGSVTNCSAGQAASVQVLVPGKSYSSSEDWIAGFVGGIVGQQGQAMAGQDGKETETQEDLENAGVITGCSNESDVSIVTSSQGPNDRFGYPTAVTSQFLGGIAGYACGNVSECWNTGAIDSGYYKDGELQNAFGTRMVGGIVGAFRSDLEISTATDTNDPGLRYNLATGGSTVTATLSDCQNTGKVLGLGAVGGICGQAGSYTVVTRCSNEGMISATRYTKPIPAGICGRSYGLISYCYNLGDVETTTGGGYYAAGIVGMLHSIGRDANNQVIVPEMYACYNAGHIIASTASYRSGSLVGELDEGYIHHCFSLEKRSVRDDVSGLDSYTGTIDYKTTYQVAESAACSAENLANLNALAANDGWGVYFAEPQENNYNNQSKLPVLVTGSFDDAKDLSGYTNATVGEGTAAYSASADPVPTVSVRIGSTTLVQNVDYRVIPQAGTAGCSAGSTTYQATIEGIGHYTGILPVKATYRIGKGSISSCTVTAESKYFNWEQQKPDKVTVYDAAGNVVDESQYTWDVDAATWNDGGYKNAQSASTADGYPIVVKATSGGNYSGSLTSDVFKIKQVSFVYSNMSDNPNADTLLVGDVSWTSPVTGQTQTWKFTDVCAYTANGGKGDIETRGALKVKYTGSAIKPTISVVTYMGKELKQLYDGDAWYLNPYAWGYKVLYGNPNPELDGNPTDSDEASVTNVTGTDYAAMTLRSAPNSNFDNYVTIWFEITPALLDEDVQMTGFKDVTYSATQSGVKLTYNGMTLVEGTDYTVEYEPTEVENEYKAIYTGMGNYAGTVQKTFKYQAVDVFPDVPLPDSANKAWYSESVYTSVALGLFKGNSDGTFAPNTTLTRGQLAAVLWRYLDPDDAAAYDKASAKNETGMADVEDAAYYTGAANWAVKNGVITGKSDGNGGRIFDPNGQVTAEQLCVILYNATKAAAPEGTSKIDGLADGSSISTWAKNACEWSMENGVLSGYNNADGTKSLRPQEGVSRARTATILVNAIENGVLKAE